MTNNTPQPQPGYRLYGLDHLRALAIILVFFFHYQLPVFGHPQWLPGLIKFGWTGVDLFFVLSGFLISSHLFAHIQRGRRVALREFFIKRAFRILPVYWVVVALYCCLPFFREREALPSVWQFLTFTQNLWLDVKDHGTFSHAWSLCVEEHFYLFLPLLVALLLSAGLLKKGWWLLIALVVFGLIIRSYLWQHYYQPHIDADGWWYWYRYIYYPTYSRLDGLLAGVSIAGLYQFAPGLWHRVSKYGNILIAAGLAVLAVAYWLCMNEQSYAASVFGFPVVAVGYGLMVMGAVSPSGFLYRWRSSVTTFIATASYALYLSHKGVIHITQHVAERLHIATDGNLMLLVCMTTCVTAAWLLHRVIERPFMRLRNKALITLKPVKE